MLTSQSTSFLLKGHFSFYATLRHSAIAGGSGLSLHELLPNLKTVSDFVGLPGWLLERDPKHFERLFAAGTDDIDATLPDGTMLSAAEAAAARLEVGEMRRQVDRIRRDYADDPEAAVGQAKELIETACKTIFGLTGDSPDNREDLPKLVTKTMAHLGLDPAKVTTGGVEARAAKRSHGRGRERPQRGR